MKRKKKGGDSFKASPPLIHKQRRSKGRKVVGSVKGDSFTKKVKSSTGMLREPEGWSFDVQSLRDAERAGATKVVLHDQESGKVYRTLVARIWERGFRLNRKFGPQICLPLHFWKVELPGTTQQLSLMSVANG